jgi:hypothetical protein
LPAPAATKQAVSTAVVTGISIPAAADSGVPRD